MPECMMRSITAHIHLDSWAKSNRRANRYLNQDAEKSLVTIV